MKAMPTSAMVELEEIQTSHRYVANNKTRGITCFFMCHAQLENCPLGILLINSKC